jgi:hypothetical protein
MFKIVAEDESGEQKVVFEKGKRRNISFAGSPAMRENRGSKFNEHFSDPQKFIKWVESYINNIV